MNPNEQTPQNNDQPQPINPAPQPTVQPAQPQTISPAPEPMPSQLAQPQQPVQPINTAPTSHGAISSQQQNSSDKSFIGTFILSWILGCFGADRFYVGKIGTAILKLVTFGGLGIWAVIDLILVSFGNLRIKTETN